MHEGSSRFEDVQLAAAPSPPNVFPIPQSVVVIEAGVDPNLSQRVADRAAMAGAHVTALRAEAAANGDYAHAA